MKLNDAILKIVNDNSGGCKITELIPEIITMICEGDIDDFSLEMLNSMTVFPEFLEGVIWQIPELKMLEYTWKGIEPNRGKIFVYTP